MLQTRRNGGKLLYEMVRQTITERIAKGVYKPDVALPSVQGFVAELGVSAITIRRALTDLQNAGLLRAVPGLGTYVNATRRFVRHLNRVRDPHYGAFEEALHIGKTANVRPLSVELVSPQDPVFGYFEASTGRHVCINKLILIDDEPMALEHTFVTMPFDQALVDELSKDLMYRVLRRRKFKLSKNRLYFDAAPASPDVAAHLGVPPGYPTIRHFYNPVIKGNRGFMIYGVSISPFDRLAYAVDLPL
ncbi:MAG: GntR family transcriptional regulator [Bradyrhizobium sp.]|nr:GntR family transcriptional regulator [Bradyrhizobium sp.]